MSVFKFQQFDVNQSKSGMKICTDSVLFGAMMPVNNNATVIDIGAGTGLLSLMAAQLGASKVKAIELTKEAYEEASLNFKKSDWSHRLNAVLQDIQSYAENCNEKYDLVISNPPFFKDHCKSKNLLRQIARHSDQLSFSALAKCANKLLKENGVFYCLIPVFMKDSMIDESNKLGLYLNRTINFHSFSHKEEKVVALTFSKNETQSEIININIYKEKNVYSKESEFYLKHFLLRFAKNA